MNVKLVGRSQLPFHSVKPHSHPYWELVLNLEGEGVSRIGGEEYPFRPGTMICHPPEIPHSKYSDGHFNDIYIQVADFRNPSGQTLPVFQDDEERSMEMLMFLALKAYQRREDNYVAIVDSLYEAIWQLMQGLAGRQPQNPTVEMFKNELARNFADPDFRLASLVEETRYCGDHFRRCFKKETGLTPMAYLIRLRIEHAKRLLKQQPRTGMPIAEIAYLCGFYDPRYFSRLFREKTGTSPQEYVAGAKE